ncbi:MAG: bifunctional 4-hydroxy-2-oxoglutarate aldolase/2-dehydro-3-deoxy-phosphogluconate aldolase [Acidobacteria bacterium]|nr:bifunctional 4-hydroxy-2-oxoglutarate aldolase/2-dehydro-3-deoxy-phosphogluconate aldolase [Acidobacteriota bacterium]
MTKDQVLSRIFTCGVLPVIRADSADEARQVVDAICEGGIDTIEITLTIPDAITLIRQLTREFPGILFGAGTVMDADNARQCIDAGANFIISPATVDEVIRVCNEDETIVMPGALTPTEIVAAVGVGADAVKVFPVGAVGGAKYIRSLLAPLPDLKLVPTGGVTVETASECIEAGAFAVGLGSDLVDIEAIRTGRSSEITETARRLREAVTAARQ